MATAVVDLARQADSPGFQADALMALGEVMQLTGTGAEAAEAIQEALVLYEAKEDLVSAQETRLIAGFLVSSGGGI